MRIKLKDKVANDCKVIRRFTLFPMRINKTEISWLEWIYIVKVINSVGLWESPYAELHEDYVSEKLTNKEYYYKVKKYIKETNSYPTYSEIFGYRYQRKI